MKKYLILIIAFILLSCTKEDETCECLGKFTLDGKGYFYIDNVKIDCETRVLIPSQAIQVNAFWCGCK